MSPLSAILASLAASPGRPAVLATLVKVVGSAYRRPGAMMLVTAGGGTVGAISGGCLESDVRAHAERVLAERKPTLLHYDLARDDPVWGLGMGCKADIDVLLEPVAGGTVPAHLDFSRRLHAERRYGVVATVFGGAGSAVPVGARLLVAEPRPVVDGASEDSSEPDAAAVDAEPAEGVISGDAAGSILQGPLLNVLVAAAHEALERRRTISREHRESWGTAEVLYDLVIPPIALYACGGDDALPVQHLAEALGWQARLVTGDAKRTGLDAAPAPDPRTAAVVMTHNYERDRALLRELLPSDAGYIGILGPRVRTEQLVGELRDGGAALTEGQLARLHGPVGLDVGAETSEEVALAIVAEIQAFFAAAPGRPLREKKGAIHG